MKMDIKQTYASFDINPNSNIFIESFDGKEFSINIMNKQTLEIKTVNVITAKSTTELNDKFYEELVKQEVLTIYGEDIKNEFGYIDDEIIDKITSIYTDPKS